MTARAPADRLAACVHPSAPCATWSRAVTPLRLRAIAAPAVSRPLRGPDGRVLRVRPVSRIAWCLDGTALSFTEDDVSTTAIAVADGALVFDRPGRTLRASTVCVRLGGTVLAESRYFRTVAPGANRLRVRRGQRTVVLPLPASMRGGRSSPASLVRTDDGGALILQEVGGRGPYAQVGVYLCRYSPGADRLVSVDLSAEARKVLRDEYDVVVAAHTGFGGGLVVETYDDVRSSIVRVPLDGGPPRTLVRDGTVVSG